MSNSDDQQRFGSRYVLGEPIGRGAMGVVHLGTAAHLDAPVAVKLLRSDLADDPAVVTRFVRERNLFRQVDHPHVVRVHEFVVDGDRLGIVMEYVEGGDLRGHAAANPLAPAEAVGIMAKVVAGLAAVHEAGIVHRDLKPANILVDHATGAPLPKISDFGVSRLIGAEGTRSSMVIGTPLYMAPESVEAGDVGPAADLYAVGVILFELLAGRPPFEGDNVLSLVKMHALEPPPRLVGGPRDLGALVDGLLAKRPSDRPTASETVEVLDRVAPSLVAVAGPLPTQAAARPGSDPDGAGTGASSLLLTNAVPPPDSSPSSDGSDAAAPPADWPRPPVPITHPGPGDSRGAPVRRSAVVAAGLGLGVALAVAVFGLSSFRSGAEGTGLASDGDSPAISGDESPSPAGASGSDEESGSSGTARFDGATSTSTSGEASPTSRTSPTSTAVSGAGAAGPVSSAPDPDPVSGSASTTSVVVTDTAPTGSNPVPPSTTVDTVPTTTTVTTTSAPPVVDPSIVLVLSTFPCDGAFHQLGTISGMTPNGVVRYTSPTADPPTYTDTADAEGRLRPTWRCTDSSARTISRTATDVATGRSVTYQYTTQPN